MKCRHCGSPLSLIFADLGATPVANDYLAAENVLSPEPYYPLRSFVCRQCRLVQLEDFRRAEDLFRKDYAYFSSVSSTWVNHVEQYAKKMIARCGLSGESLVVEIASNDGCLLYCFQRAGIKVLGIEPCESVAGHAVKEKKVPTRVSFFGRQTARGLVEEGLSADLMVANNVLAHVPDINDFVLGFKELLKPEGAITFEFPHLLCLISENQFDTIYHEHFSYLSLTAVDRILRAFQLRVFDVERLPTHGGSLRLFVCHEGAGHVRAPAVDACLGEERDAGLDGDEIYAGFNAKIREVKFSLLELLINLKRQGKKIAAYGAPAKGNTLLNFCGINADFLDFTVDKSPSKQGRFLPGTRLPVYHPDEIFQRRPDYIMLLPWNIKEEIMREMARVADWGGKFIVPIPKPAILSPNDMGAGS